jgi:hypothetical protein
MTNQAAMQTDALGSIEVGEGMSIGIGAGEWDGVDSDGDW